MNAAPFYKFEVSDAAIEGGLRLLEGGVKYIMKKFQMKNDKKCANER